jgi:hypothetical protein
MKRLVQTIALGAALIALAVGVWRDLDMLMTLRRAALGYLLAYFLTAAAILGCRAALRGAEDPEPEVEAEPAQPGWRRAASPTAGRDTAHTPPATTGATRESPEAAPVETR